jgi:hypothetical protein
MSDKVIEWNVVIVDNFGRDYNGGRSEKLVSGPLNKRAAEAVADEWNERNNPSGNDRDYAVVRDASIPLYIFDGY